MDFKDNNDTELDIQALLDKYLPDEKNDVSSDKKAKADAQAFDNDFFISSEADEALRLSDSDDASETPLFEDSASAVDESFGGNKGESDDSFVFDEALIAELIADNDVQFGGIEGFEDLEGLSGFTGEMDKPESDAVDLSSDAPAAGEALAEDTPVSSDEAAGTLDTLDFAENTGDIPLVKEKNDADILNEEDYAEFVNASLDELDSDEATDTDINLIVAFGLEEELKQQVGAKKASRITKRFDSELEKRSQKEKQTAHAEYKSPAQTKEISEQYKKRYISLKLKIAFTAVFALLLMVFENLPVIGYQWSGAIDPAVYPVVYVMVDLQLLLLCFAAAYEEIFAGFGALLRGKPLPESVLSLSALLSVIYSAIVAKTSTPPTEPTLFNFPIAFCALMALIYSYLTVKREIFSFNVVSSKKPKYAIRKLSSKEAALEAAAFSESEDNLGDVLKIEKVSFIDDYFFRTESRNASNAAVVLMLMLLSVAFSCLFGGYAGVVSGNTVRALYMGYMAYAAAVPISVLVTYAYPFYKANADSYENDSTIVGEMSLEEYSGASVISFEDNLVFPSAGVKVKNIKVYNNYRFDRVLYYAASVFTKTGGPLSDIFEMATVEMGCSDDVVLTNIGAGYIQTLVNGKTITFGRAEELSSLGINMPSEIVNDDDADEDTSVMYMVFKDKVVAKMHIVYTLDDDFDYIVKQLAESGMSACIKTFDPNIDEDMIKSKLNLDKYPLRVIKCTSLDEASVEYEHSESGVVARGTPKGLLQTVVYCDRVLDVKRTNSFIGLIASIITVAVLAVILLTDNISEVRSLWVVLCHLFWMIPMLISTKTAVR